MGSLELYDMFLMSGLLGQYHGTINAGMSVFDTTHISNITLTVRDLVGQLWWMIDSRGGESVQ